MVRENNTTSTPSSRIRDWKDERCTVQISGTAPNYRWLCVACNQEFTGGVRKFKNHILGIKNDRSAQIRACEGNVSDAVREFCEGLQDHYLTKKRQRDAAAEEEEALRQAMLLDDLLAKDECEPSSASRHGHDVLTVR